MHMKFKAVVSEWINSKYSKISPKTEQETSLVTIENYINHCNVYLIPAFGEMEIDDITPLMIHNFINDLYERNYSDGTVSTMLSMLTGIMNFAKQREYIDESPVPYKNRPVKRNTIVTEEMFKNLISVAQVNTFKFSKNIKEKEHFYMDTMYYVALEVVAATSLKQKEEFGLYWTDINKKYININRGVVFGKKTKHINNDYDAKHSIDMSPKLYSILKKWEDYQRTLVDSELVFSNVKGELIDVQNMHSRWWKRIRELAGYSKLRWLDLSKKSI